MSSQPQFSQPVKKQTMAEQMAEAIQEAILSGELDAGDALPAEPELAEQFEVSRAVVRDATRILMARGLVEVQHGRGVFVTAPQNEAFGQALLLALQRVGASAWDVEQFSQVVLPSLFALAATTATDQELAGIRQQAAAYIEQFAAYQNQWHNGQAPAAAQSRLMAAYRQVLRAILDATHNRLVQQLAPPLLKLLNLRTWADLPADTPDLVVASEARAIQHLVDAISSRDPDRTRADIAQLMDLPREAIQAMKETPVGEIVQIPLPPSREQS